MDTLEGRMVAIDLDDVADAVIRPAVAAAISSGVRAPFAAEPATPPYVKYHEPPLRLTAVSVAMFFMGIMD